MYTRKDRADARKMYKHGYQLVDVVPLKRIGMTRSMIKLGCPMNVRHPRFGISALHCAVYMKDTEQVKLLLAHGANVNILDKKNLTPVAHIKFPMDHRSCEILQLLLDAGAKLEAKGNRSIPLSFNFFMRGSRDAVEILLKYGFKLTEEDSGGNPASHYMAFNKNKGVAGLLKNVDFDVNVSNGRDMALLYTAVIFNNAEFVRVLLGRGADSNSEYKEGHTPLHWALIWPTSDNKKRRLIVDLLLENGANMNLLFADGGLVAHIIEHDTREIIRPVLKRLAIMDAKGMPIQSCQLVQKIQADDKLNNYYNGCRHEIERMLFSKAYGNVSFFNILIGSADKVSNHACTRNAGKFFMSCYVDVEFPHYAALLRRQFKKTVRRQQLMQNAANTLSNLLQFCDLDPIAIDKILGYLSNKDLSLLS